MSDIGAAASKGYFIRCSCCGDNIDNAFLSSVDFVFYFCASVFLLGGGCAYILQIWWYLIINVWFLVRKGVGFLKDWLDLFGRVYTLNEEVGIFLENLM